MARVDVYRMLGDTNYNEGQKKVLRTIIKKLAITSGWLKFIRPFIFSPKELKLMIGEVCNIYAYEILNEENKIRGTVLKILSFALAGVVIFGSLHNFFSKKLNKEKTFTSDSSIIHNNTNCDTPKKVETDFSNIELFDIFMNKDIKKVREDAINTLISFCLIAKDGTLNFSTNDFKKLGMSLRDKDDMFAITHIYVFELAVEKYDSSSIDDYYRGIKCKVNGENRYFTSKEDFLNTIGKTPREYASWVENNIIEKNGDIWNYYSCKYNVSNNNPRLGKVNDFEYNGQDRGQPLCDIEREQEQSLNMVKGLYR